MQSTLQKIRFNITYEKVDGLYGGIMKVYKDMEISSVITWKRHDFETEVTSITISKTFDMDNGVELLNILQIQAIGTGSTKIYGEVMIYSKLEGTTITNVFTKCGYTVENIDNFTLKVYKGLK